MKQRKTLDQCNEVTSPELPTKGKRFGWAGDSQALFFSRHCSAGAPPAGTPPVAQASNRVFEALACGVPAVELDREQDVRALGLPVRRARVVRAAQSN